MDSPNQISLQKSNLFIIILLEGFITISAEILTIRQLMPLVGNSVIVTSLIIGVFLLFLAYGYLRGGKRQGNYAAILANNFLIAALLLGIGLSYSFIDTFFYFLTKLFAANSLTLLIALIGYLLLITAPLVYILGQTVPITMKLYRVRRSALPSAKVGGSVTGSKNNQVSEIGEIGGTVLHLSTLGSFLGAVLTTLLLMNFFGVATTVFINYCGLLTLITLLMYAAKINWLLTIIAIASLPLVYFFNLNLERSFFSKTNAYANYYVHDDVKLANHDQGKLLEINKYPASFIAHHTGAGFEYMEKIKQILFKDLRLNNAEILVLGAGGFSLSAAGDFGNHVTYVDIDPNIQQIAQDHFIREIHGDFVAADARSFLQTSTQQYQVIISDVYSAPNMIPQHLITQEYFRLLSATLAPNGIVIINIIANPLLADKYSKRVDNTIRSVFSNCMVSPGNYGSSRTNILYTCYKPNANTASNNHNIANNHIKPNIIANHLTADIYTDDLNQASTDVLQLYG